MIGAVLFLNARGDVILSRTFRSGFNVRTLTETFRNEIISTSQADRCPVNILNRTCFIHMKLTELYVVLVSTSNVNCLSALEYGVRVLQHIQSNYGELNENTIKDNFVALQSYIEESLDFGYPILTDGEAITQFVTADGVNGAVVKKAKESEKIADRMTGITPWRVEGLLFNVNEIFVDVFEDVNLLLSQTGETLQSHIAGRVVMNNFLSGMPDCELTWNSDVMHCNSVEASGTVDGAVCLTDIALHNCVRINKTDNEKRKISFVPPNGKFTLMSYRSAVSVAPPMRVISAKAIEVSKTRTEIEFSLKSDAPVGQVATNVQVKVPCPDNTATVAVRVGRGKAKYDAVSHGILWDIPQMESGEEIPFTAEVKQIASTEATETLWSRPPISIAFQCISLSLTGLKVEELKVAEPTLMYSPNKWIRYTVLAGDYQCRI